uniref:Glycoside hydrolase family 2 protein n=1 Tax=Chryseobacterium endophyticum TaxID=1854762 RepID=A0AAU6WUA8_9FLAO
MNDTLTDFDGDLQAELLSFDGKPLWASDAADHLPANSSGKHLAIEESDFAGFDLSASVLRLSFDSPGQKAEKLFYFGKPKDLKLSKPTFQIKKVSATEIEISTDVLAKDVYLMGDTHFSDNFFDLLPNTSKKIILSKPVEKIEVMSLWDTMNK